MNLNISWNKDNYQEFIRYLINLGEDSYKDFNKKVITTNYETLGIRIPLLRKIASEIFKGEYQEFLEISDSTYYEEVMIKGFVIGKIKEIDEFMMYFNSYLDLIDNWAICDCFCNSLKIINKNKNYFLNIIDALVKSNNLYYIRVGLVLLLSFYVEEEYIDIILKYLEKIKSNEYYVNMAKAWLLCEVFVKYQDKGLKFLMNNQLDKFTINKAISKIRDSYRVSKETKDMILAYKK